MKISFQRGVIKREVPEFLAFWKPPLSFILFKWFEGTIYDFLLVSLVKTTANQHFFSVENRYNLRFFSKNPANHHFFSVVIVIFWRIGFFINC